MCRDKNPRHGFIALTFLLTSQSRSKVYCWQFVNCEINFVSFFLIQLLIIMIRKSWIHRVVSLARLPLFQQLTRFLVLCLVCNTETNSMLKDCQVCLWVLDSLLIMTLALHHMHRATCLLGKFIYNSNKTFFNKSNHRYIVSFTVHLKWILNFYIHIKLYLPCHRCSSCIVSLCYTIFSPVKVVTNSCPTG